MAVAVKPSKSLINIRSGIKSIKDSFSGLKKNNETLNATMLKKTKVKKESIARNYILSQRRKEEERRKNREDLLEASTIGGAVKRQAKAVASSAKGFLGRIMDFLATLLVGWLLTNLPSIITMAQELIARIQRLYTIVTGFFNNTVNLFRGFGNLLSAVGKNILTFDFTDSKGRVESALKDLGGTFDDMQSQFDEGFKLLTTSLGEGVVSGENAQPFGTQYENESMQEQPSGGTSGGEGSRYGTKEQRAMLDSIAFAEGTRDQPNNGYKTLFGFGQFNDYSRHPDKVVRSGRYASAAAGRYQFMPGTFNRLAKKLGLKDFSPASQDKAAIELAREYGVTQELLSKEGMSPRVSALLGRQWASFPGKTIGLDQPTKQLKSVQQAYQKSLGSSQQTPAQTSPRPAQTAPAQTSSTPVQAPIAINPSKTISKGTKVGDTIKTSGFGWRWGKQHGGIDLGCDVGTYISCRYPCKVVEARYERGYGYYTDIIIPSLNIRLRFAHLSSQLIKSGNVPAGKPFARSGNSGAKTTGPHIHMEATRNMGGTSYGGDFNPDPYVDAMIFSKKPPQGFVAPSTPSTPTPAQIASPGTQQRQQASQQLAQQPSGPSIVIIEEEPPAPQPQVFAGGGESMMIPIIINPLNSYIRTKLLLDLAYT